MYTAETITMAAAAGERPKGTDVMAALPEDILVEVFSRVGAIKDLFFFAVTSQWWLHLFTDPAFLRRLCRPHLARLLLGFLFQPNKFARCERMMRMRMAQRASVSPPTFLPALGSPLGPAARALTSFVSDDGAAFNYAEPLAARRGVVLMQLVPRTFDLKTMTDDNDQLVLGLCDLFTGERHVPPPLHGTGIRLHVSGYAIVTAADADLPGDQQPSGSFTFSQLLLITAPPYKGADHLHLHSYSAAAAARGWEAPAECLDRRRFGLVGDRSAAVHDGAAHWLCMDHEDDRSLYKLSVEVGTAEAAAPRVSLAKLAGVRVGGTPLLCVSGDGELSVACVYPMHAAVWAQQQGGDDGAAPPAPWVRTRVVRIPAAAPNPNDPPHLLQQCRHVWLDSGMGLVLVVYRGGGVFLLDLEKEVVDKVMDSYPRLAGIRPYHIRVDVPYKLGLVDLFVGRLGPRRSRWGLAAA